jgi:8-oxo-dGTP diphosphatase
MTAAVRMAYNGPKDDPMLLVTAALIRRKDTILIARRKPGTSSAGLWEFPGGKVEPGESPAGGLARELREEFEIGVRVGRLAATGRGLLAEGPFELLAFEVEHLDGEFKLTSHDEVRWVRPEDLAGFELPDADREVVAQILERGR